MLEGPGSRFCPSGYWFSFAISDAKQAAGVATAMPPDVRRWPSTPAVLPARGPRIGPAVGGLFKFWG
jgi:hypothetical protein